MTGGGGGGGVQRGFDSQGDSGGEGHLEDSSERLVWSWVHQRCRGIRCERTPKDKIGQPGSHGALQSSVGRQVHCDPAVFTSKIL